MTDGWSISSTIGTCLGALFTLLAYCLSFKPHSLLRHVVEVRQSLIEIGAQVLRRLGEIKDRLRDIHDSLGRQVRDINQALTDIHATLVQIEDLLRTLAEIEWEITGFVTGRAQPRSRRQATT